MRDAYGFWLKAYLNNAAAVALVVIGATTVGLGFATTPAPVTPAVIHAVSFHHAHRDLSHQALDQYGGWQVSCEDLTPAANCWYVLIDGSGY